VPHILRLLLRSAALAVTLASALASAQVSVNLDLVGQPSSGMADLVLGDPIAVGGQLLAVSGNQFLQIASVAAAAVDLSAGTLRVYSSASVIQPLPTGGLVGLPGAQCQMGDLFTVSGPGSSVTVTATLDVSGTFAIVGTGDGTVQQVIVVSIELGSQRQVTAFVERDLNRAPGMADMDALTISPLDGGVSVLSGSSLSHPAVELTTQLVVPVDVPTGVYADLQFRGGGTVGYSSTANFGDTARLSLALPAGYTFTSHSGVLLSQAGGPGLELFSDAGVNLDGGGSSGGTTGGGTSGGANPDGGSAGSAKSGGCSSSGGDEAVGVMAMTAGLLLLASRLRPRTRRPIA
jgi:hypothetical protein